MTLNVTDQCFTGTNEHVPDAKQAESRQRQTAVLLQRSPVASSIGNLGFRAFKYRENLNEFEII